MHDRTRAVLAFHDAGQAIPKDGHGLCAKVEFITVFAMTTGYQVVFDK